MGALANRVARELKILATEPPPGIVAWPEGNSLVQMCADVQGPQGSVYEGGVFRLDIVLPERYPMEPPKVQFVTPIHHPNIDAQGRICLDALNLPPKGSWSPARNISTILISIQMLLAEPNPDDGLVLEVTEEYKYRREAFNARARHMTQLHAAPGAASKRAQPQQAGTEVQAQQPEASSSGRQAVPASTSNSAAAAAATVAAPAAPPPAPLPGVTESGLCNEQQQQQQQQGPAGGQGEAGAGSSNEGSGSGVQGVGAVAKDEAGPLQPQQRPSNAGTARTPQPSAPTHAAASSGYVPATTGVATAACDAAAAALKRPAASAVGSRLGLKKAKPADGQ